MKKLKAIWELMRLEHGVMLFLAILIGSLISQKTLRITSAIQTTRAAVQTQDAATRRCCANSRRRTQAHLAPRTASSQTTKAVATGAAAFWQGYAARLGLGITRTRNQSSKVSPAP